MALDRVITILEAVAIAGRPLSASELQDMTGMPLPTCYRQLQSLKEQGLLDDPDSNRRFVIGRRLQRIAHLSQTDADVCSIVAPALQNATADFGDAVFFSRFRQQGVNIIHVETPQDPALSYIHPGLGFRPMHACSCSKAIAAFADDGFRELILKKPRRAYTEHTRTERSDLESEFNAIRKNGYAECVEEIEIGISSVAAPITVDNQGAIFSVGTIGSIRRFTQKHRRSVGNRLKMLASELSQSINRANSTSQAN